MCADDRVDTITRVIDTWSSSENLTVRCKTRIPRPASRCFLVNTQLCFFRSPRAQSCFRNLLSPEAESLKLLVYTPARLPRRFTTFWLSEELHWIIAMPQTDARTLTVWGESADTCYSVSYWETHIWSQLWHKLSRNWTVLPAHLGVYRRTKWTSTIFAFPAKDRPHWRDKRLSWPIVGWLHT